MGTVVTGLAIDTPLDGTGPPVAGAAIAPLGLPAVLAARPPPLDTLAR